MSDVLDEEIVCPAHPIFPILTFNKQTKQFKCAICIIYVDKDKDNA